MAADTPNNTLRIIRILQAFVPDNAPQTSAALHRLSGTSRSTFHGLLREMCRAGWLERCDHGTYRLGPKAAALAYLSVRAAPPRVSAPRRPAAAQPPATPQPVLPSLHPDLLQMQDTQRFQRLGPVRIGFANASLSNPWRHAFISSFRTQAERLESRIASVAVRHANDDPSLQVRHLDELVTEGVDALIISACDARDLELSDQIQRLSATGIPVIAVDRRPADMAGVTTFVTASDRTIGAMSALWLAEHLRGQGVIWLLSGRNDTTPAKRRLEGARMIFDQFPGLDARYLDHTDWTEDGGYAAAQRIAHSGAPTADGVWCDSGLHGIGSVRWFLDHAAKAPPHTGGDQNLMYKLCLQHRIPFAAIDYPYAMGAQSLVVALDLLAGRPVPKRIEVPLSIVMPRGCQTKSVIPDIWAETHVGWDEPDDMILPRKPSIRPRPRR